MAGLKPSRISCDVFTSQMPRSRSRSPPRHSHRDRDRPKRDYEDSYRKRRRSRSEDRYDSRSFRREDRRPRGPEERDQKRHRSRSRSPKLSRRATGSEDRTGVQERKVVRGSKSKSKSRSASPEPDKAKPNFKPSGLLAAATNTVKHEGGKSTVLKYNEPPEARKPTQTWRLYAFKGAEETGKADYSVYAVFLIIVVNRCSPYFTSVGVSRRARSAGKAIL
jgi:smad nuclear-interacting protein 1